MKISVIIPTYKPQSYVWECLDSLENQTFSKEDFEVILVLNGCDEPYRSQLKAYIKTSQLIYRFIHTERGGVSNARNLALDVAKGEYITFIDDDDYVSPKYLEELFCCIDSRSIAICYPYYFNDGNSGVQLSYHMTDIYEKYFQQKCDLSSPIRSFFSGPCMKLIPKSVIANHRFDKRLNNGEDTLFMFIISDNIHEVTFAKREAVYYRRNRVGSAVNVHKTFRECLKSNMLQVKMYIMYYMRNPMKYNFSFFATRVCGAMWAIMSHPFR